MRARGQSPSVAFDNQEFRVVCKVQIRRNVRKRQGTLMSVQDFAGPIAAYGMYSLVQQQPDQYPSKEETDLIFSYTCPYLIGRRRLRLRRCFLVSRTTHLFSSSLTTAHACAAYNGGVPFPGLRSPLRQIF